MVGGSSDPSVPRSSGVSLQKGRAAHGPRHPALTNPLRPFLFLFGPVFGFRTVSVFCVSFLSRGTGLFCKGARALQDPTHSCRVACCPFHLSLSLTLSLSIFFCCWSLTSTRTLRTTSTPRSPPRLCFYPTTWFVFPVVVGLGLSWVCWACLSLSLYLSFLVVLVLCMHVCIDEIGRGGGLLDGAPVHDYNHCFVLGLSMKRWGEQAVLSRRCCFGGSADRTVMQMFSRPSPVEGGNAVIFFHFLRLARRPLSFFCNYSSLRVAVRNRLSGAKFVFGGWWWSCVFGGVLPTFLFYDVVLRSQNCFSKILFTSGHFWGFGLFTLGFLRQRSFRDTAQVATGHTLHLRLFGLVPFVLFLSPPRLCYRPFWPCFCFLRNREL